MVMHVPTIYATKETRNGKDLFTFECTKCGKKHTHGYSEGHRVEHCAHDAKDRWEQGYILREKQVENKMSRIKDWLMDMQEDASEMTRSEWIEVHGESNIEIYDEAQEDA
jgi:hypothetical protein